MGMPALIAQLNFLLGIEGLQELRRIHTLVLNNMHVRAENLQPSLEQIKMFFKAVRDGIIYSRLRYGEQSVPQNMQLYGTILKQPLAICYEYEQKKALSITHLYIAQTAFHIDDGTIRQFDHLQPNQFVRIADMVMLQTVEECYHCYQFNALCQTPRNHDTLDDRADPFEQAIFPVIARAISDWCIPIYSSHPKPSM